MSPDKIQLKKHIQQLDEFIRNHRDSRETLRALAVKMALQNYVYRAISRSLGVSCGFISKWKKAFMLGGVDSLKLAYKGSKSYLSPSERQEVIDRLVQQESWDISELECWLIERYDIAFKSPQSYYQLFKEARITWQKGEQINPRQDPEEIAKKNQEIADLLEKNRADIETEKLVVYILDECHLLWNDICNYLWNFIQNPIKLPISNPKERQTYYGALNLITREFTLLPYPKGKGEFTIDFVQKLQAKNPKARLLLIWDGAPYHRSQEIKDFLTQSNSGLTPENWKITCQRFACYAPQENPVEAIWLQLKTLLRRFYRFGKSFKIIKRLFQLFVDLKLFNLPDLKKYDAFSQFI